MASTVDPWEVSKSIEFRRIHPSSERLPASFDSEEEVSIMLIRAMKMRQKYMRMVSSAFQLELKAY
jgi:hypothetical protein